MQTRPQSPSQDRPERRQHRRIAFSPLLRPQLRLPLGTRPIIDASYGGLRVYDPSPVRPQVGSALDGTLEFPHGEPPIQVRGTVSWVASGWFALKCDPDAIPFGYLPAR